ncbi:hypothetical protein METHPM2_1390004 [Pseudomonas sp. PM2]
MIKSSIRRSAAKVAKTVAGTSRTIPNAPLKPAAKAARTAGAISRMTPNAPPRPAAKVARTVAAISPTTAKKLPKPGVKVANTATAADAKADVLDAGEQCSPAFIDEGHHAFTHYQLHRTGHRLHMQPTDRKSLVGRTARCPRPGTEYRHHGR